MGMGDGESRLNGAWVCAIAFMLLCRLASESLLDKVSYFGDIRSKVSILDRFCKSFVENLFGQNAS
jgi:hypothetical protein